MKNTFVYKTLFFSLLFACSIKATDRDIDLFGKKWAEIAKNVVHLRDEKAHLIAENKRLAETIDERSIKLGRLQGVAVGTVSGIVIGSILTLMITSK